VEAERIQVHGLFREDVEHLLGKLTAREADVLRRRFGLPPYHQSQILEAIGEFYGVTRERIRQIEAKALQKIREALRERGLEVPESRRKQASVRPSHGQDEPSVAASA
jgi:DNA-directed RNA polymerase sigma subunit (sigma70/sigma32)